MFPKSQNAILNFHILKKITTPKSMKENNIKMIQDLEIQICCPISQK